VSILIELVKYYKKNPLKNYSILFLWCGAEEWGMKGSEAFCREYVPYLVKEYDMNSSILINIDMVGTHLGLLNKKFSIRTKNRKINNLINFSAHLLNIPIQNFSKFLKIKSDHLCFKKFFKKSGKHDTQIAFFHSVKDRKYVHTKKDTPDRCSKRILDNCFKICILTSLFLDSKLK
jgi:Zn-dependent M28 family amino/carboxypeptidase